MVTYEKVEEALRKMAEGATEVDLSSARIGDSGASRLAEALKKNTTLKELHLYSNAISDEGACALAETLPHNTVLQKLWLSGNFIGNAGAWALTKELQHNHALHFLDIGYNDVEDEDVQYQIQALLQRNKVAFIVLQVTTVPASGKTETDHAFDLVVTKISGNEVLRQPLQPETTLKHIAMEVAALWRAPLSKFRWVLPGPQTVGPESLDRKVLQLLQGGLG